MSKIHEDSKGLKEAAMQVYEAIRAELEPEHIGKIIAIEPESAKYVLGITLSDVNAACRREFGTKPVFIFSVGGGGVKLFGSRTSARILGRA